MGFSGLRVGPTPTDMTDLSFARPPAGARGAVVPLLVALGLLAAVAAVAWTADALRLRLVGDDTVSFPGTFPAAPSEAAAVYQVGAAPVSLTRGVMVEHFGFPEGRVHRQEPGDGSVVLTTGEPGEGPGRAWSRLTFTPAGAGLPPMVLFQHLPARPPAAGPGGSAPAPERVRAAAESTVRDALVGLGLPAAAWSVTARDTLMPSGDLSLLVEPVIETAHGTLPVGAAAPAGP